MYRRLASCDVEIKNKALVFDQAFTPLDHPLFRERESVHYHFHEFHCSAKLLEITGPCLILFFLIVLFIQSATRQCAVGVLENNKIRYI